MSSKTVVILDIGGVVTESPFASLARFAQQHKIDDLKGKLQSMRGKWAKVERGEKHPESFVRDFQALYGIDLLPWLQELNMNQPHPKMLHVISLLREKFKGIRVIAITNSMQRPDENRGAKHFKDVWGRPLFDFVIESHVEGVRKGDGDAIFRLALRRLGDVPPTRCIFLDDFKKNLRAADQLGMKVFHTPSPIHAVMTLMTVFKIQAYQVPDVILPRKGLGLDKNHLQAWLEKNCEQWDKGGKLYVSQFSFGQSNPTYHLICRQDKSHSLASHSFVLRKKPPGKLLPSAHDVLREHKIMESMHSQGIPVPEQLAACNDPKVIGTDFYIMRYVPGMVLLDPSLKSLAPKDRRKVYLNLFRVLAKIHDANSPPMKKKLDPTQYIPRQLKRWGGSFIKSPNEKIPEAQELLKQLAEHPMISASPSDKFSGVVHGDFRLNNCIYNPGYEVAAVVDWELSTVGDCLVDVVSGLFDYFADFQDKGGLPWRQKAYGIPSPKECLDEYCKARGISTVDEGRLRFLMGFQAFRLAAILQGVTDRASQGNTSAGESAMDLRNKKFRSMMQGFCKQALGWLNGSEVPGLLPAISKL